MAAGPLPSDMHSAWQEPFYGRLETRSGGRIVRLLGAKIGIHMGPTALAHVLTVAARKGADPDSTQTTSRFIADTLAC